MQMSYGIGAEKRENPVDNLIIYNKEIHSRLSPGLQLRQPDVC